jgi:hypothetical protein
MGKGEQNGYGKVVFESKSESAYERDIKIREKSNMSK